ncbi:sigma-70 family RNA polymerase sigma factor [Streptomyces sp. NPDC000351]|uniref:sigma-70 family RNA polymerase sigma factor n=1 Tax=Streptomyces sp. NPDC000351 TaxID=3154250 RepID=UPI00331FE6AD
MALRAADEAGSPGMRAAMGELLVRLRRAAVKGVVPESAFLEGVRELSLGDGERERLRDELARLGLPVRDTPLHTEGDKRNGEKVAPDGEENVFPRIRTVLSLVTRYADADGYVTPPVVDGVARLAGLSAREAALLRAQARVRGHDMDVDGAEAVDEPVAAAEGTSSCQEAESAGGDRVGATATGSQGGGPVTESDEEPEEEPDGELPADLPRGDLAEAVAAAHAVLERDRRERRPGARLLDAQAEVGLSVLLRGGPDRIGEEPTEDDLKALAPEDLRIRARDCLVVHNQRLVHSLARPCLEQGLDYEDLLQHGFLGLLRAARKFDASKGFKFSTYATWWIRQSITRAIADEGALIRIPVHMHEQMRKVARAERTLMSQGRPATAADVAVACDMTLRKVEEIRRLTRRTDSLDRVVGDGATLADFVGRAHALPSVEQQVVGAQYLRDVLNVVDTFTEREARVLVRRLGLDGDEPSTLDELGREFGVTRERIRQVAGKARPALLVRLREAGLVGGDAVCEAAERSAEEAAEAERVERFARAIRAARTARARLVLRRVRAERLARAVAEQAQETTVSVRTPAVEARGEGGDTSVSAAVVADWEHARRLAQAPVDQVSWLADYVRTAVGDERLVGLLGQSAADAVVRGLGDGTPLSRPVLTALEVLRRVFDAVAAAGQRPEHFLDRPADALRGVTPRAYLEGSPLVNGESRLAVRDALREFLAAAVSPAEPEPEPESESEPESPESEPEPVAEVREAEGREAGPREEPQETEPHEPTPPAGTTPRATADWDKARTLARPPLGGGVAWLAEYALLALGYLQLSVLLGSSVTDSVVRAARQRGMLDRPVVEALEVLREVLDTVKRSEIRPEHFFEKPADALLGVTPRAYLATKPLVRAASRLAVRDALREFVAAPWVRAESAPPDSGARVSASKAEAADAGHEHAASIVAKAAPVEQPSVEQPSVEQPVVDVEGQLAAARARHETELALLAREHERRLSEVRGAADQRVAAVRADAERRLGALEEELLHRADRALERREAHVRRQAEAHLAHVKEQHRESYEGLLRRAEAAEEAARQAVGGEQRADELEQRLRDYRQSAEARVRDLESRLRQEQAAAAEREGAVASAREEYRQGMRARVAEMEARLREAEAAVAQRDLFVAAARQSAEEAEQQAAQRIAQSEHDAWLRVSDLQAQLSAVQTELAAAREAAAAQSRTSLRDRWRRS